jgi:hypothetical protein
LRHSVTQQARGHKIEDISAATRVNYSSFCAKSYALPKGHTCRYKGYVDKIMQIGLPFQESLLEDTHTQTCYHTSQFRYTVG